MSILRKLCVLLIGSVLSFGVYAAPLYLPLPIFVDRVLVPSNAVSLEVEGTLVGRPLGEALRGVGGDLERARNFVSAMSRGDAAAIAPTASETFTRSAVGLEGYIRTYRSNWQSLSNHRLEAVLQYSGFELVMFSAQLQGRTVFPTLFFKQNEAGVYKLIPDDRSESFQILSLWAATLSNHGLVILTAAEAQRTMAKLPIPEMDALPGAGPLRRPVLMARKGFEASVTRAAQPFSAYRSMAETASRLASASGSGELEPFLQSSFTPASAGYVRNMPADERIRFLKTLSESSPVGFMDLGVAQVLVSRHGPSESITLTYLSGAAGALRLTNIGRASAVDSFLLNSRLVPRIGTR